MSSASVLLQHTLDEPRPHWIRLHTERIRANASSGTQPSLMIRYRPRKAVTRLFAAQWTSILRPRLASMASKNAARFLGRGRKRHRDVNVVQAERGDAARFVFERRRRVVRREVDDDLHPAARDRGKLIFGRLTRGQQGGVHFAKVADVRNIVRTHTVPLWKRLLNGCEPVEQRRANPGELRGKHGRQRNRRVDEDLRPERRIPVHLPRGRGRKCAEDVIVLHLDEDRDNEDDGAEHVDQAIPSSSCRGWNGKDCWTATISITATMM